jgi:hypothetical protein
MIVTCVCCGASLTVDTAVDGNLTYDGMRLLENCGRQKTRGSLRTLNVADFDCPDFRAALLAALQRRSRA